MWLSVDLSLFLLCAGIGQESLLCDQWGIYCVREDRISFTCVELSDEILRASFSALCGHAMPLCYWPEFSTIPPNSVLVSTLYGTTEVDLRP